MDWTTLLTAISAIGAAGAAGAAAWQAYETRKQGEIARGQFLQARYDDARPIIVLLSSDIANAPSVQLDPGVGEYSLSVQNVGRGPAFHIRVVLSDPEKVRIGTTTAGSIGLPVLTLIEGSKKHWYYRESDYIKPDEKVETKLTLKQVAHISWEKERIGNLSFYAPEQPLDNEYFHICRAIITYRDVFQQKYSSVYDLEYRGIWQFVSTEQIQEDLSDLERRFNFLLAQSPAQHSQM